MNWRGRCMAILTGATLAASFLAGCQRQMPVETDRAQQLSTIRYPDQAATGEELDIVARREDNTVRIINRTPRTLHSMQLWLNRQYVLPVEHIEIGDNNVFPLAAFINRYQEAYPVGRLLAPEENQILVLAELYHPQTDTRHPLKTISEED